MSQEARVSSVLVLKQLRAALGTFAETAARALEEASTEIQRAASGSWRTDTDIGKRRSRREPNARREDRLEAEAGF